MASTPLSPVLRYIRKVVDLPASAQLTDSQLLDRFVRHRNEAAFSALVERHGPMVMGICRRLLCNSHDAEDAFQATFLVLVRRAEAIGDPDLLANWLYGVAFRTAAKAKADVLRRRAREGQAASNHQANAPRDQDLWDDLRPILDEEINLLPVTRLTFRWRRQHLKSLPKSARRPSATVRNYLSFGLPRNYRLGRTSAEFR